MDGLKRVVEYIRAHDTGDIGLADMARIAGVTPHHFASSFSEAIGLSPHQYVLRSRIERAKKNHLQNEALSIAEVSRLIGFQTQEHFSKVFRRIVGITPSEFRQESPTTDKI